MIACSREAIRKWIKHSMKIESMPSKKKKV